MTNKYLYSVAIPSQTQRDTSADRRRNLMTQGVMGQDSGQVASVSTQPGEYSLNAIFSGVLVELPVAALEELFNASGFESVPFAATNPENATKEDGYYGLGSINIEPLASQTNDGFRINASMTKEGTRTSHWRAIKTTPTGVRSPYGGNQGAEFAIPEIATKTRWYDEPTGTLETATPKRQIKAENGTMEVFDAKQAPGEAPTLLYDVPYHHEFKYDCRVWDDFDRPKELVEEAPGDGSKVGSATVGTATVGAGKTVKMPQWQRVFRTDHEFYGKPVVESGGLRIIPDETNGIMRAYRWDYADKRYTLMQLGASPWRLFDFDLTEIGPATLKADVTFQDTSGNEFQTLKMVLQRGFQRARFLVPKNDDYDIPSELAQRVAPIARYQTTSAQESQTLMARREVSR
ncbi:hypothetical protein SAMN05421858_5051 [Haladaptatus litoreus]|uniref:Uncharacterized protein n=1 Tax=Haladaptatus litoreus TaxID=553468 RepID=A0A1N7FH75_9EURY|nr:hypothetical protein [Haladaptatus litoreus]SIR99673.1 hypothetical protein SAMN05421858_5051 [Haladaptatus litoreus]